MRHDLYESPQEMLSSGNLTVIAGQPIRSVRTVNLEDGGATASPLLAVETNDGQGPRFVLKRVSVETNWIMRATDDRQGRETLLWRYGLFDQFPSEIRGCVIACSHDVGGWAILMRDVREALLPATPFDNRTQTLLLNGLARLHATFWERSEEFAPSVGFCDLETYYVSLSERVARRESRAAGDFPSAIVRGWEVLERVIEPDLAHVARRLSDNPARLCRALSRYPPTLVHRDLSLGNLGLARDETTRVVLLDWQFAGPAPPGADLGSYLSEFTRLGPCSKEETIEQYVRLLREQLGSRFSDRWWRPQLELSLLGEFVRLAWAYALHLVFDQDSSDRASWKAELGWWSQQARGGLQWL